MFTQDDLKFFEEKGIAKKKIEKQIKNFENGFPFLDIIKPATIGDGIIRLDENELRHYVEIFEKNIDTKEVVKMVPASGAASRMFKALFEFLSDEKLRLINNPQDLASCGNEQAKQFIENVKKFAFAAELDALFQQQGSSLERKLAEGAYAEIIGMVLTEKGLNYGNMPKGLLKFHNYAEGNRTPIEEHMVEGANYAKSGNKIGLHFTVSPEHLSGFKAQIEKVKEKLEKKYGAEYNISFSVQKTSTDTLAVDLDNKPFRNSDNSLLFRPGGHGALIENLNDLTADIVFIKNIDNVILDSQKEPTFLYKKALGGILMAYQDKIFDYVRQLKSEQGTSDNLLEEIGLFLQEKLCTLQNEDFKPMSKDERVKYLVKKLNRPLRVCGMVKNEGEPGGGPFWATNADGTLSLQVVESSQIDPNNKEKQELVKDATHFNPVDLVCGIKGFLDHKFNLLHYVDPQTGFISQKSKDGKVLKALELPGLWNGAMADWNTIFVEVPIATFSPVKIVNDLLRKEHQE